MALLLVCSESEGSSQSEPNTELCCEITPRVSVAAGSSQSTDIKSEFHNHEAVEVNLEGGIYDLIIG